jgi:hypothetical protein
VKWIDGGTPESVSLPGTVREDQGWFEALVAALAPRPFVAESRDVVDSGGVRGAGRLRPERPAPAGEPRYESLFMPELEGPAPAAEPCYAGGGLGMSPSEAMPQRNAGVGRFDSPEGQRTAAPPDGMRGSLTSRSRGRMSSTPDGMRGSLTSRSRGRTSSTPDGMRGSLTSRSRGRTSSTPSVWQMGAEVLPADELGNSVQVLGEKSV